MRPPEGARPRHAPAAQPVQALRHAALVAHPASWWARPRATEAARLPRRGVRQEGGAPRPAACRRGARNGGGASADVGPRVGAGVLGARCAAMRARGDDRQRPRVAQPGAAACHLCSSSQAGARAPVNSGAPSVPSMLRWQLARLLCAAATRQPARAHPSWHGQGSAANKTCGTVQCRRRPPTAHDGHGGIIEERATVGDGGGGDGASQSEHRWPKRPGHSPRHELCCAARTHRGRAGRTKHLAAAHGALWEEDAGH